jgi:hypothetical protein
MESALKLDALLVVDVKTGDDWEDDAASARPGRSRLAGSRYTREGDVVAKFWSSGC